MQSGILVVLRKVRDKRLPTLAISHRDSLVRLWATLPNFSELLSTMFRSAGEKHRRSSLHIHVRLLQGLYDTGVFAFGAHPVSLNPRDLKHLPKKVAKERPRIRARTFGALHFCREASLVHNGSAYRRMLLNRTSRSASLRPRLAQSQRTIDELQANLRRMFSRMSCGVDRPMRAIAEDTG